MDFKYELHHLKGNTYYIDGPTNCGVYVLNDKKKWFYLIVEH